MFGPTEPQPDSERLNWLQGILARLLVQLDIDESVVTFKNRKVEEPEWARKADIRHRRNTGMS
jgi:hypothetical protein